MVKLLQTGVYCIRHKRSGKRYVGSAARSTLLERWADHLKRLRGGYHYNKYLQRAWNKYGEDAFEFIILERCPSKKCVEREQYWMDYFKSSNKRYGYNETPKAGSMLGFRHTKEMRKRISQGRIAGWRGISQDGLRRISESGKAYWADPAHRAMRIVKLKKAAKNEKMQARKSAKMMGHVVSEETKRKISEARKGFRMSKEQKAKLSEITKQQWANDDGKMLEHNRRIARDPAIRAKASASRKGMPAWNRGKKMGAEFGVKVSAAITSEVREKISVARKVYWARIRRQANEM